MKHSYTKCPNSGIIRVSNIMVSLSKVTKHPHQEMMHDYLFALFSFIWQNWNHSLSKSERQLKGVINWCTLNVVRRKLVAWELVKASGMSLSNVRKHLFARQTGLSKSVILQLWHRNHPTWNVDDCPRSGKHRVSDDSDEALFGDARARIQRLINT